MAMLTCLPLQFRVMNVANIINKSINKVLNQSGIDVSPKRLIDENFPPIKIVSDDEKAESASSKDGEGKKEKETERFKSKIHREKHLESEESQDVETVAPSPEIVEKKKKVKIYVAEDLLPEKPEKLFLKLKETDTIWLLTIPSGFSQDDPMDAEKVSKENESYKELTTGKGLTRKRATAETQTAKSTEKSKGTVTAEIKMRDSFVNASAWDLYDTYAQLEGDRAVSIKEFQIMIDIALKTKGVTLQQLLMQKATPEEQVIQLFDLPPFRYALLITERLLASNNYQQKQSVFKKHLKSRYDDVAPTLFSYDIEELWAFKKDFDNPMMVTGLDWNPYNPDLLAVGYGHFHFGEGKLGLVCVWSPKNPGHPEREFVLNDPVTCLNYSTTRPNILAVGCRSGDVYIIDVSTEFGNLRILGRDKIKFRHGPVWKVQWYVRKEIIVDSEDLLAVGEGGILIRFTFPDDQETTDILKLQYIASITKSHFQTLQKGSSKNAPQGVLTTHTTFSTKSLSGLSFSLLKNGRICYVSTKEGVVIRCIVKNPCRTERTFSAHSGPIYNIEHSPFTDLIYFTCGSDWCLKIWMEGVSEPLMVLPTQHPVVSAKWSPTIATIIATLSGSELALWDIARRVSQPVKIYDFEHGKKPLSTLLFSPKGTNIVVGDQQGHVKVFHLSQLPRQPFLQIEALINSIERALYTNQTLLKKFRKTQDQNKDILKTRVVV